jgi:hypothetical protein
MQLKLCIYSTEKTSKLPPLLELFNNEAVNTRKMEGNGKKCDFGQNCKNKALNTLTNCSKLTINHLRYLKSNSKELEIAENYLILNRAGINVITSQDSTSESPYLRTTS